MDFLHIYVYNSFLPTCMYTMVKSLLVAVFAQLVLILSISSKNVLHLFMYICGLSSTHFVD